MVEGRNRVNCNITGPADAKNGNDELVLVDDESQGSPDNSPTIRSPRSRIMSMKMTGKKKKKVLL